MAEIQEISKKKKIQKTNTPIYPSSYQQNGLLPMLERNRKIKNAPERFQESKGHFDVIFCFEERVFDAIVEGMRPSKGQSIKPTAKSNQRSTNQKIFS